MSCIGIMLLCGCGNEKPTDHPSAALSSTGAPDALSAVPSTSSSGSTDEEPPARRDFLAGNGCAKGPIRPPAWEARPGEEIVARYDDGSWRGGKVRRLTPTTIHVSWEDRSPLSIREPSHVAPKPKTPHAVAPGQTVLVRPRKGAIWDCGLVEKTDSKGVVVIDKDGGSRKARAVDVLPAEP